MECKTVVDTINNKIKTFLYTNKDFYACLYKSFTYCLSESIKKYNFECGNIIESNENGLNLSRLNEKTSRQKELGAFYTSSDVCNFILINSIYNYYFDNTKVIHNLDEFKLEIDKLSAEQIDDFLYKKTFIDPTCGDGEFLLSIFTIKVFLLKKYKKLTDETLLKIIKCIYGNDLIEESTDISKIRIFISCFDYLNKKENAIAIAKILNKNFKNYDFIKNYEKLDVKADFIVGNPPYIEYSKYNDKSSLKGFGNVYADVLINSFSLLKKESVIGFIIPISYSSTIRMKKLRDEVIKKAAKEIVMSFADRPDCLFPNVHQKLNILIVKCGKKDNKSFSSSYYHWNSGERNNLFNKVSIIPNEFNVCGILPKIGNQIEKNIFQKIYSPQNNFESSLNNNDFKDLYFNMRACFWMKCFSFNPGSSEYKKFLVPKNLFSYYYCLFNSTLFWMFWTIISDEWHITNKELNNIKIIEISIENKKRFDELYRRLESKLDATKKYIGTKQVDYEYKHKECKDIIDEIDDYLCNLYGISHDECDYIKKYELKYRTGDNNGQSY